MDRHKDKGKKDFNRFLHGKARTAHKVDYTETAHYKQLARKAFPEDHYASIHANYSTVEELNALIIDFYKPNCSLHLNIPDDVLLTNPDMHNISLTGLTHCSSIIKKNKEDIKHNKK